MGSKTFRLRWLTGAIARLCSLVEIDGQIRSYALICITGKCPSCRLFGKCSASMLDERIGDLALIEYRNGHAAAITCPRCRFIGHVNQNTSVNRCRLTLFGLADSQEPSRCHYLSFEYSAWACFRTGMSESVSFQRVRKSP